MTIEDEIRWIKREPRVDVSLRGDVCCKRYRVPLHLRWREAGRRPRAQREYENLSAMRAQGLPTIEALDWKATRSHGLTATSSLWTRWLEGQKTLREHLRETRGEADEWATALGTALRRIHEAGFICHTASPRNWLLPIDRDAPRELVLLDLPFVRRETKSVFESKRALVDLYSVALGESRRRETTAEWRLAVLTAYCRGDREQAAARIRAVERWTRRKFRRRRELGIAGDHLRRMLRRFRPGRIARKRSVAD